MLKRNLNMKKIILAISLFATIALTLNAQTERIEFTAPGIYPEGVTYHSGMDVFFVSSVRKGTIGKVTPGGVYSVLYDDSTFKSTFGMKIDAARNLLWVCAGDPNYSIYRDSSTWKKMTRSDRLELPNRKESKRY
jgi:sugar lactone lactonase YvrE